MVSSRVLARSLLALLALAACLVVLPEGAEAAPEEKVTICHRTSSRTNPYDQQAVARSSAVEGHKSHTGPVFSEDVERWGDIIPPITPGLPQGLNWNAEGRAVLDNGCEVPPDVGPLPAATIGDAACTGTTPTVDVTVGNDAGATDPATFTIRVNGEPVQTVGPVAPGDSETVTLTGAPEDEVAVIEVVSDGQVIASKVVTADCAPGPPPVTLRADLGCSGDTAVGRLEVSDNGPDPIEVQLFVDGSQVGPTVTVAPGATETREIDVEAYEDRTVTARVVVDGETVATYTITPDCVAPAPTPSARVAGTVCPPPTATVTLANGQVTARRIDLRADDDGMLTNTLPRELTHVVLADMFSSAPPKWAIEGMAILAGSQEEISRYTRTLSRCARDGELRPLSALFDLKDYPADKATGFYCQSVSVVEYLVKLNGERNFKIFLSDAQRYGTAQALKRQYNIDGPQALEVAWKRACADQLR